jgi:hypothetical protein
LVTNTLVGNALPTRCHGGNVSSQCQLGNALPASPWQRIASLTEFAAIITLLGPLVPLYCVPAKVKESKPLSVSKDAALTSTVNNELIVQRSSFPYEFALDCTHVPPLQ